MAESGRKRRTFPEAFKREAVATLGLRSPFDGAPVEALPIGLGWLKGVTPTATPAVVEGSSVRVGPLALRYDADGVQRVDA